MSKAKWALLAVVAIVIVVFVVQDRLAYSTARQTAVEKCAADFDAQFGESNEKHREECDAGLREIDR